MRMEFYDDDEADKLVTQFFKYYYYSYYVMIAIGIVLHAIPNR